MSKNGDAMDGQLGYFTIPVRDLQNAKAFFGALFGWQFEEDSDTHSHIANSASPAGGISMMEGERPEVWFRVPDAQAAVARVRELGGTADDPVLYKSGWSAACKDGGGTAFNIWQPAEGYA